MQRLTKTNKTTLQSERTSALKKDLTGPTLLEMSGNPICQESRQLPDKLFPNAFLLLRDGNGQPLYSA